MEFNQKLQILRRQKGLTQEELAQAIYVSRTAISKWESGRGYPNIDSLKALSRFFCVSIDELLSGEEVLAIAEADHQQKERNFCDLIFGLLDCSMAMLLFLPIFGQETNGTIHGVSLLALAGLQSYIKTAYFAVTIAAVLLGIAILSLQNCTRAFWMKNKNRLSLFLSAAGVFLFIISRQPYAAALTFVFLLIKAWIWLKQR